MRSFIKRCWPILGVGILLAIVSFYLIKSDKKGIREILVEDIMPGEGQQAIDIHYAQNDPEKGMTWALEAKEMRSSGDKNSIVFSEFRFKVTPKKRPTLELTGARGDYHRDSGEINLWGNLEGSSGNGFKIFTDHILINEKSRKLTSDKPIKILGPFFSIDGEGCFVDFEKETITILTKVTAVINKDDLP